MITDIAYTKIYSPEKIILSIDEQIQSLDQYLSPRLKVTQEMIVEDLDLLQIIGKLGRVYWKTVEGNIYFDTDKSDKILGIHAIGSHATEIIGEAAIAISKGLKVQDLINTIHAHPTIYEGIYEAAENIFKKSITILNK